MAPVIIGMLEWQLGNVQSITLSKYSKHEIGNIDMNGIKVADVLDDIVRRISLGLNFPLYLKD